MAVASNASRMALSLVTLPALLSALGQEGLGVWLVALSFQGLFGFLASGFTSSTITATSRANVVGSDIDVSVVSATAFYVSLAASLIFFATGIAPVSLVNWHSLLRVGSSIRPEDISALMWVMLVTLSFNFVSECQRAIIVGRMEGYAYHALNLFGIVIAALGLLTAIALHEPIQIIAAAFLLPQSALPFLGGIVWLSRRAGGIYRWKSVNRQIARGLITEGWRLAINQAAFALASSSDLTLIGLIAGAAAGTPYGIAQRLFAVPHFALGTVSDALWPVFARADARGDIDWLSRFFPLLMCALTALVIPTAILVLWFYPEITTLWMRHNLPEDWLLVAGAAVMCVMQVLLHAMSVLLRAMRMTGFLAKTMIAMATFNVPLSAALIYWIGAAGSVWGSVIAYAFCLAIPQTIRLRRRFGDKLVSARPSSGCLAIQEFAQSNNLEHYSLVGSMSVNDLGDQLTTRSERRLEGVRPRDDQA